MQQYPGVYRGMIEDVDDPQARGRYRVRVFHVHPDEVPTEHLPWAEVVGYGGKGFGDVPHYNEGDLVVVQFEGALREYPFVMGGWLSRSYGVHDMLPEQTQAYKENRKRWARLDREGNEIVMSELPHEFNLRLKSDDVEIVITKVDNSVRIDAIKGTVSVNADQVTTQAEQSVVIAKDVVLQAYGDDGQVNIYSTFETRVWASDKVFIGQYMDDHEPKEAKQGANVTMQPIDIVIGRMDDVQGGMQRTMQVSIEGYNEVNVKSRHLVNVDTPVARINCKSFELNASQQAIIAAPNILLTGSQIELRGTVALGGKGGPKVARVGDGIANHSVIASGSGSVTAK